MLHVSKVMYLGISTVAGQDKRSRSGRQSFLDEKRIPLWGRKVTETLSELMTAFDLEVEIII